MARPAAAPEAKRQLLLDAAVRVFARKGYHASRVGDIAEEAGVSYGLLYHYFESKEEVLETIFRTTWTQMLGTIESIESAGGPARDQLRRVIEVVLRTWRRDPDLVRVLVREVTRSPNLEAQLAEVGHAITALQRVVERGQSEGDFRSDVDPLLAGYIFYGALEEVLTGWALGRLPDDDEGVAAAELTVVRTLCEGLLA